jgi:uncharacterized protein (TIGR04255 family)
MMQTREHYSKAPIAEAIIEFRVKPTFGIGVIDLEKLYADAAGLYPTRRTINFTQGRIEVGERVSATTSTEHLGFVFVSEDKKQVFQARLDGFAMSRLAPYENWNSFRDEARRLWNIYKRATRPERVDRVAVRYVNRFDLPLPLAEMKDYFRTVPEVSPDLPQILSTFFMQLNIPQEDGCTLLLNQTIADPPGPGIVSIVLDIDLFRESDLPTDEEGLWSLCERLRERKNRIFNACITERTKELIR